MVWLLNWWFYSASCFGPLIIIRTSDYSITILNHESIHSQQQKEMWYLPAYFLYITEFLIKLLYYRNISKAYMNISFEREAYLFQGTVGYLSRRKPYQHLKLIYLRDKKEVKKVNYVDTLELRRE